MFKWRGVRKRRICCIIAITLLLSFYYYCSSYRKYQLIKKENVLEYLQKGTTQNFSSIATVDCFYNDVYLDETVLSSNLVDADLPEGHKIREGGVYSPHECRPKYSAAIIVPYRDRVEQLRGFLIYMHIFLHLQHIQYRIFVVEQVDSYEPYNRAKLINIGAAAAIRAGYACLILHDVDLLPLKPANLYACTKDPRHMSFTLDTFKFSYSSTTSNVISISSKQFKVINGISNKNFRWRDDLYSRLDAYGIKLCQYESEICLYHVMEFRSEAKWEKKKDAESFTKEAMSVDGLNSLKYTEIATVLHPLFTHIMVDLAVPSQTEQT